jgi:Asp-tRNA(Asn)/Glu-tRNA(Gln) amidotransferase A subunit family amidase
VPIALKDIFAMRGQDETTVLRVAHAYQRSTDWHQKRPLLA